MENIINQKVFWFMVAQYGNEMVKAFEGEIQNANDVARSKGEGSYEAFGSVIAGSPTQVTAYLITRQEVEIATLDYSKFFARVWRAAFVEIHRLYETYLIELFGEIARKDPRVLKLSKVSIPMINVVDGYLAGDFLSPLIEERKLQLTHASLKDLRKNFDGIGLPIIATGPECERVTAELEYFWSARNILQHNDGIINQKFLDECPTRGHRLGDMIDVNKESLRSAIGFVEGLAVDVNRRAVEKYSLQL